MNRIKKDSVKIDQSGMNPVLTMHNMFLGFMKSQLIYVAVKLDLAEALEDGPKSVHDLALRVRAEENSLMRLLRALASLGIFSLGEDSMVSLTPMAGVLSINSQYSLKKYILLFADVSRWTAWGDLLYSIRTGNSAFENSFGMTDMEYFHQNPDLADAFDACMHEISLKNDPILAECLEFPGKDSITDIGGGIGNLLSLILKKNPHMKGILFDRVQLTEKIAIPGSPFEIRGGDFFVDPLPRTDIYLMKQILHDWGDRKALQLLKNCRKSMSEKSRLIIIEVVLYRHDLPNQFLLDLNMLVLTEGGRLRTEKEHEALLGAAGFSIERVERLRNNYTVITARKA